MNIKNCEYKQYSFKGKVWRHQASGGWYFVSLPKTLSAQIRKLHHGSEEGWGRLKSKASISDITWETAIWFDKKHDCYLLPIKADIRMKQNIHKDSALEVQLLIEF